MACFNVTKIHVRVLLTMYMYTCTSFKKNTLLSGSYISRVARINNSLVYSIPNYRSINWTCQYTLSGFIATEYLVTLSTKFGYCNQIFGDNNSNLVIATKCSVAIIQIWLLHPKKMIANFQ